MRELSGGGRAVLGMYGRYKSTLFSARVADPDLLGRIRILLCLWTLYRCINKDFFLNRDFTHFHVNFSIFSGKKKFWIDSWWVPVGSGSSFLNSDQLDRYATLSSHHLSPCSVGAGAGARWTRLSWREGGGRSHCGRRGWGTPACAAVSHNPREGPRLRRKSAFEMPVLLLNHADWRLRLTKKNLYVRYLLQT